jgi:hypothetical protein
MAYGSAIRRCPYCDKELDAAQADSASEMTQSDTIAPPSSQANEGNHGEENP